MNLPENVIEEMSSKVVSYIKTQLDQDPILSRYVPLNDVRQTLAAIEQSDLIPDDEICDEDYCEYLLRDFVRIGRIEYEKDRASIDLLFDNQGFYVELHGVRYGKTVFTGRLIYDDRIKQICQVRIDVRHALHLLAQLVLCFRYHLARFNSSFENTSDDASDKLYSSVTINMFHSLINNIVKQVKYN